MTSNAEIQAAAAAMGDDRVQVLLVEDDDGDALLVGELLLDVGGAVVVRRARSLAQAKALVPGAVCVLLDLGLPDSQGLDGLRQLLEIEPDAAVIMLTGESSEHLGERAVRAGAQDYLVKGEVSGHTLNRVIRYAVERRRAEETQRALRVAQILAQENARLERGLLPQPLLADPRLTVDARCLPGGKHHLLGGDFYDVVETGDGWVHALIGDVCGRGPAEAALGVCLRVAWRTMVLAGRPGEETLFAVNELLEHERQDDTMFATLCMLSVHPDRTTGRVRMAGHLPPLLLSGGRVAELPTRPAAPLGLSELRDWPGSPIQLAGSWSVLLYTDGLIEGKIGQGSDRLGSEGLMELITAALEAGSGRPDGELLDQVIGRVRDLNGGDLNDDLAALMLTFSPRPDHG